MLKHKRDNSSMDPQKIVTDLLQQGLTQKELAALAECSQSLISALSTGGRGKRLSFQIGSRLYSLHQQKCPKLCEKSAA